MKQHFAVLQTISINLNFKNRNGQYQAVGSKSIWGGGGLKNFPLHTNGIQWRALNFMWDMDEDENVAKYCKYTMAVAFILYRPSTF